MHSIHAALLCFCLTLSANVNAENMQGNWEYVGTTPDSVYGQPESFNLAIRVDGDKVCGSFMSAYRGGMKVAEGSFTGTLSKTGATVLYDPGWSEEGAKGEAKIQLKGEKLSWSVVQPGAEPDYVLHLALLHHSNSLLDMPEHCK